MFKKLKNIYEKFHNYEEYAVGEIHPQTFYKWFFKLLQFYGVYEEPAPRWAQYIVRLKIASSIAATVLLLFSLYRGVELRDLTFITEAGIYFALILYQMIIIHLFTKKSNIKHFLILPRIMREDFKFACSRGDKYRQSFFKNQIQTSKLLIVCFLIEMVSVIASFSYVVLSLVFYEYYTLPRHPEAAGKRPLPYPYWLGDLDFGKSPLYEIFFIYSLFITINQGMYHTFLSQVEMVMIREITAKLDIIQLLLEELLDGIHAEEARERKNYDPLIKLRMKEIIQQHQSVYKLIESFCSISMKVLMYEQKIVPVGVSLGSYVTCELWKANESRPVVTILVPIIIFFSFVPCFLCNFMRERVNSICDICSNIPFWEASPVLRPYLVLMMQRALRPLPLTAAGFKEVSLESFGGTMASSYSLFNMIRQVDISL